MFYTLNSDIDSFGAKNQRANIKPHNHSVRIPDDANEMITENFFS